MVVSFGFDQKRRKIKQENQEQSGHEPDSYEQMYPKRYF